MNTIQKLILQTLKDIYTLLIEVSNRTGENPASTYSQNKPNLKDDELFDMEQVRTILKIGRITYYRFVKDGKLIPRKIGKRHWYYLSDLDDMIRESKRRGRI